MAAQASYVWPRHDDGQRERVTWLIPVKNAMPHLPGALASIHAQAWRNFEVLVWDNGSTDGSLAEVRRWIPHRLPGRVVADQPLPLGASLARMVVMAQTELCARFDADDINEPDRAERQVAFLRTHPKIGVLGTNLQFIDTDNRPIPGGWNVQTVDAAIRWRLRFCNAINHPTVMFRRSVVLAAGNYREVVPEDYDLWIRVAARAAMANLPQQLLRYRHWSSVFSEKHGGQSNEQNRQAVQANAALLFPGLSAYRAMLLRDLITNADEPHVTLDDCRTLHRAATAAAVNTNERGDYFRKTDLYRSQMKSLTLRWLKGQPGIRSLRSTVRKRTAA